MSPRPLSDRPVRYRICVVGRLDRHWSSWFDGLEVAPQPDGTTLLTGYIRDQAALHGVLIKIRDLGLPLIAVQRLPDPDDPPGNTPFV
jgi:hypothetical protein